MKVLRPRQGLHRRLGCLDRTGNERPQKVGTPFLNSNTDIHSDGMTIICAVLLKKVVVLDFSHLDLLLAALPYVTIDLDRQTVRNQRDL